MANIFAVITVPYVISEDEVAILQERAQRRLGEGVRVIVVTGGVTCDLIKAD